MWQSLFLVQPGLTLVLQLFLHPPVRVRLTTRLVNLVCAHNVAVATVDVRLTEENTRGLLTTVTGEMWGQGGKQRGHSAGSMQHVQRQNPARLVFFE